MKYKKVVTLFFDKYEDYAKIKYMDKGEFSTLSGLVKFLLNRYIEKREDKMREDFELEFDVDGELYFCCGSALFEKDSNWGADADGNRGVSKVWLEDIHFDSILDNTGYEVYKSGKISAELLEYLEEQVKREVLK